MQTRGDYSRKCWKGPRIFGKGFLLAAGIAIGLNARNACAQDIPPVLSSAQTVTQDAEVSSHVPLAPIGVFGANQPAAHQLVLTATSSYSRTDGNLIGASYVSPAYIVDNILSDRTPASGNHLLRVVPLNGHVFGESGTIAYGVTGKLALVLTGGWLYKQKELETFKGLSGQAVLGTSLPFTRGVSDTTVAALYRIYQDPTNAVTASLGLELPTGSYRTYWTPLSPMGTYVSKVAVYGMQEGSGSYIAVPAVAYTGTLRRWAWGLSYRAQLPLENNDDGWRLGQLQTASAWAGYSWLPDFMSTVRVATTIQGRIRGEGAAILGYAEGNVPGFAGGQEIDINLGATISGRYLGVPKLVVQVEAGMPVYQYLNGPQAASQWSGVIRTQYRF